MSSAYMYTRPRCSELKRTASQAFVANAARDHSAENLNNACVRNDKKALKASGRLLSNRARHVKDIPSTQAWQHEAAQLLLSGSRLSQREGLETLQELLRDGLITQSEFRTVLIEADVEVRARGHKRPFLGAAAAAPSRAKPASHCRNAASCAVPDRSLELCSEVVAWSRLRALKSDGDWLPGGVPSPSRVRALGEPIALGEADHWVGERTKPTPRATRIIG